MMIFSSGELTIRDKGLLQPLASSRRFVVPRLISMTAAIAKGVYASLK
jgi:hypothetical protein